MWKFAQENPFEFFLCVCVIGGTIVGVANAIFGGGF